MTAAAAAAASGAAFAADEEAARQRLISPRVFQISSVVFALVLLQVLLMGFKTNSSEGERRPTKVLGSSITELRMLSRSSERSAPLARSLR